MESVLMAKKDKLSQIQGIDHPTEIPDSVTDELINESIEKHPLYRAEKIKQEGQKTRVIELHTNKLAHEIECLKDDRSARKIYGYIIFGFVILYIIAVLVLFSFQIKMTLPKETIIALLSTASINVIGLLAAVVRYVFPRRDGN